MQFDGGQSYFCDHHIIYSYREKDGQFGDSNLGETGIFARNDGDFHLGFVSQDYSANGERLPVIKVSYIEVLVCVFTAIIAA